MFFKNRKAKKQEQQEQEQLEQHIAEIFFTNSALYKALNKTKDINNKNMPVDVLSTILYEIIFIDNYGKDAHEWSSQIFYPSGSELTLGKIVNLAFTENLNWVNIRANMLSKSHVCGYRSGVNYYGKSYTSSECIDYSMNYIKSGDCDDSILEHIIMPYPNTYQELEAEGKLVELLRRHLYSTIEFCLFPYVPTGFINRQNRKIAMYTFFAHNIKYLNCRDMRKKVADFLVLTDNKYIGEVE